MLRTVKSSSALRAAGSASFRSIQHRTLVSSVLLTKDAYESKRVNDLKSELKQRGLPLTGKRDELIKRLLQDDARRAGSGISSQPGKGSEITSAAAAARGKSTLASLREGEKKGQQNKEPVKTSNTAGAAATASSSIPDVNASKDQKAEQLKKASDGDLVIDPQTVVSAKSGATQPVGNANLVADHVEPMKEPESNPPGVPPSELPNVPPTFSVNIPYEQPEIDLGPEIPLVTAYTSPQAAADRFAKKATEDSFQAMPKVVAIGGESTLLGGGISSPAMDAGLSHAEEGEASSPQKSSKEQGSGSGIISELLSDVKKDIGVTPEMEKQAQRVVSNTAKAATPSIARNAFSEVANSLPESIRSFSSSSVGRNNNSGNSNSSSSGSGSGKSSDSSSSSSKPLNNEERTGAYILGAIVAGGFLLGSFGKKKSSLAAEPAHESGSDHKKGETASSSSFAIEKGMSQAQPASVPSSGSTANSSAIVAARPSGGVPPGKGRLGKALDDLSKGGSSAVPATSAGQFSSGAGIVGSGHRKA